MVLVRSKTRMHSFAAGVVCIAAGIGMRALPFRASAEPARAAAPIVSGPLHPAKLKPRHRAAPKVAVEAAKETAPPPSALTSVPEAAPIVRQAPPPPAYVPTVTAPAPVVQERPRPSFSLTIRQGTGVRMGPPPRSMWQTPVPVRPPQGFVARLQPAPDRGHFAPQFQSPRTAAPSPQPALERASSATS